MDGNAASATFLGCGVTQLEHRRDSPVRVQHHIPGQGRDLPGPQAGLNRQQHHRLVAGWVAAGGGIVEDARHLEMGEDSRLFAGHAGNIQKMNRVKSVAMRVYKVKYTNLIRREKLKWATD